MQGTRTRFELAVGLALTCIFAVGTSGCGGDDSAPSAPAAKPAPAPPTPAAAPAPPAPPAPAEARTEESAAAPRAKAEIPANLPIYPGAETGEMMDAGGSIVAQYLTDAPVDEVYAYYKDELPKQGWEIQQEFDANKRIMAAKDGRGLSVALIRIDGKTEIGVMLTSAR